MRGQPAFSVKAPQASAIPVVIAAPHGGRAYPQALLREWRHPRAMLARLEDRHVDVLARRVGEATGATLVIAHAPRAMLDLNRAPDDVDWAMVGKEAHPAASVMPSRRVRSGLGLVPRRLAGLGELWRRRLTGAELSERIDKVHAPYHAALAHALAQVRARWGAVLLIDLHSMPPLALRAGEPAVQIVVGDRFGASCHGGLIATTFAHFAACGRTAAHNRPYAGGYVLERHANPRRSVHALQIEVDRQLYLDAQMSEPGAGMEPLAQDLSALVMRLAGTVSELAEGGAWPQAAE